MRNPNLAVEAALAALNENKAIAGGLVYASIGGVRAQRRARVEGIGNVKGATGAEAVYGDGEQRGCV